MSVDLLTQISDKFLVGDDCWEWTGSRDTVGYGQLHRGGRIHRAHRVLFELFNGPIAEGLELDHLCRNRACVRPAHLEPVSKGENLRRRWLAQRGPDPRPCMLGHPRQQGPDGRWYCRTCLTRLQRERRQRKPTP